MGKQAKPQAVRGSHPPKAGKKKSYTAPPASKNENLDARGAGLDQFVAKNFPAPLPSTSRWDQQMDALCAQFNVRRRKDRQSYDTGLRYDESRKQVVVPPNRKVEAG